MKGKRTFLSKGNGFEGWFATQLCKTHSGGPKSRQLEFRVFVLSCFRDPKKDLNHGNE